MLLGQGKMEYLILNPDSGTYSWTAQLKLGQENAGKNFPHAEGIDVYRHELFFISKKLKKLFVLNLDTGTYVSHSTKSGLFDGQPDQIVRLTGLNDGMLYFTEDGGKPAGVHARNGNGDYFTILEGPQLGNETTGLSFSPDGKHMYVAYQNDGLLFGISRKDGLPFHEQFLNLK
jgi:hypothetical protein